MKPIDFRRETWEGLQGRLQGLRMAAWRGWETHGPGTTRQVAARCGMDLLTFRPRTTELFQMGFLAVVEGKEGALEGVYRARTLEEVRAGFVQQQRTAVQPELALR